MRSRSRSRSDDFDDIYSDPGVPSPSRSIRAVDTNHGRGRARDVEVSLVVPRSFNDAQQIADKFKGTVPVILNLQSADTDLSKRLIDFASGLTYALDGGMSRIADKVFLLTPRNVEVSGTRCVTWTKLSIAFGAMNFPASCGASWSPS